MEYLKYLIKKPRKLLFLLGCIIFETVIFLNLVNDYEVISNENSPFLFFLLMSILLFTLGLVIYQPYKEWKDINSK